MIAYFYGGLVPYLTLPYLTFGVDKLCTCPALRPYQLRPMRRGLVSSKYKLHAGCDVDTFERQNLELL